MRVGTVFIFGLFRVNKQVWQITSYLLVVWLKFKLPTHVLKFDILPT